MSKDLNSCSFIGRLGKDPESNSLPSGDTVVNFSIAVGDDYKDKQGQKVEQTEWVNITAFGKLAEICGQYLKKGSRIYCNGKMKTRKWQDQSGNDRYSTGVVINDMQMLDGKGDNSSQQSQNSNFSSAPSQPVNDFDDDAPF